MGDDELRASGFPAAIARPCALPKAPPRGYRALVDGQGDTMTFKFSREDVAAVIVDALPAVGRRRRCGAGGGSRLRPRLGVVDGVAMSELARVTERTNGDVGTREELQAKLEKDAGTEGRRTYRPSPFV